MSDSVCMNTTEHKFGCDIRLARGLKCFCDATLKASGRDLPGFATENEARAVADGAPIVFRAAYPLHHGGPRIMRWFVK